jgi:hypothetical protein
MKLVEAPGGISVILSNREHAMWESLYEEKCKSDLTEREVHLAQHLTSKGVVKRLTREGKTYFSRIRGSIQ